MLATLRCKNKKCPAGKFLLAVKSPGLLKVVGCPFCGSKKVKQVEDQKHLADKMMDVIDAYV